MGIATLRRDEPPVVSATRHAEKITMAEHERLMQEQAHGYELQLLALRKEAGLLPKPEPEKQPDSAAEASAPVEVAAPEPQPEPEPEKAEGPADTTPDTPVVERPMQGFDAQRHKGGKRKHRR